MFVAILEKNTKLEESKNLHIVVPRIQLYVPERKGTIQMLYFLPQHMRQPKIYFALLLFPCN